MHTLIWVLQGLLAFAFLASGAMKLLQPREKVIAGGGKWAEDYSATQIKVIGAVEVLFAIGVILPRLLHHGFYITPISAAGLALIMVGAFYTHARRKEYPFLAVNTVLFIMAIVVCYFMWPR